MVLHRRIKKIQSTHRNSRSFSEEFAGTFFGHFEHRSQEAENQGQRFGRLEEAEVAVSSSRKAKRVDCCVERDEKGKRSPELRLRASWDHQRRRDVCASATEPSPKEARKIQNQQFGRL